MFHRPSHPVLVAHCLLLLAVAIAVLACAVGVSGPHGAFV